MKKLIKVAGYQGDASVHTRSMDFFINKLSKTFDFEYEKDITLSGKKASSLIELTRNNNIQISYQSGFRSNHSTNFCPSYLCNKIQQGFWDDK